MYYPPDTYEEYMMAALAGNGCTECLATTHTADNCPDVEWWTQWNTEQEIARAAEDAEIDALPLGTMVVFPTYEEYAE